MIELFIQTMSNYALFIDEFIGIDYTVAFGIVVIALAFIYKLGHSKTF